MCGGGGWGVGGESCVKRVYKVESNTSHQTAVAGLAAGFIAVRTSDSSPPSWKDENDEFIDLRYLQPGY